MNINHFDALSRTAIVSTALAEKKAGQILLNFEDWLYSADMQSSTRRVYLSRFRQLIKFIESEPITLNDTDDDLMSLFHAYVAFVTQKYSLKTSSVNNIVVLFRLIARAAGLNDLNFERRMSDDIERIALSVEEQERYISASKREGGSTRDFLLALLFLRTNIRMGEAISIKVSDLIWEANELKVRVAGRGGYRVETLDCATREAVQNWLIERARSEVGAISEYLFPGGTGGKITGSSFDTALRRIGWRAGLNVSARVLRNSFLTTARIQRDKRPTEERFDPVNVSNIVNGYGQRQIGNVWIYPITQS